MGVGRVFRPDFSDDYVITKESRKIRELQELLQELCDCPKEEALRRKELINKINSYEGF